MRGLDPRIHHKNQYRFQEDALPFKPGNGGAEVRIRSLPVLTLVGVMVSQG
jgi:hypothetical protein